LQTFAKDEKGDMLVAVIRFVSRMQNLKKDFDGFCGKYYEYMKGEG